LKEESEDFCHYSNSKHNQVKIWQQSGVFSYLFGLIDVGGGDPDGVAVIKDIVKVHDEGLSRGCFHDDVELKRPVRMKIAARSSLTYCPIHPSK